MIVPGLDRPPRGGDAPLFLWTERESGGGGELLVAPIAEAGVEGDPVYEQLAQLDAEREDHEAARLLYVAATRARERLHLLGDVKRDEPRRAPRDARAHGSLLGEALAGRGATVRRRATAGSVPPAAPPARRAAAAGRRAARCGLATAGAARRAGVARARRAPRMRSMRSSIPGSARPRGRSGTVVHRWLQHVADDRLDGWDEARVERLRSERRGASSRVHGVRAGELDERDSRARCAALRAAIADPRGRWVLGSAPVRGDRAPICTALVDGAVRRLVIDRLFETAAGERWIVDYKTSAHEGADPEGFLDQERARYAAQLERYARALGGTSRLGLYFPLLAGGGRSSGGWRAGLAWSRAFVTGAAAPDRA